MAFSSSVGFAYGTDGYRVGANACQDALDNLDQDQCHAALIFASEPYDHSSVLDGVKSVSGDVPLSGMSTNSGITDNGVSTRDVVVVILFYSDEVSFFSHTEEISSSLRQAGESLGRSIKKKCENERSMAFMFSGQLRDNGDVFMDALTGVMHDAVSVIGGSSAENTTEPAYQYSTAGILTESFTALSICGEFDYGIGISHGWSPIGRSYKVTHSSDNIIFSIEGKPAIDFYKEYFGSRISSRDGYENLSGLAYTYPLGMRSEEDGRHIIRHPLSVNSDGSVTFNGVVPSHALIQIMIGSSEGAHTATRDAAEKAKKSLPSSPRLAVVFQGAGHQMLPHDGKGYISEEIKDLCGKGVGVGGCVTRGEYVYIPKGTDPLVRTTSFHNSILEVCMF